MTEREQLEQALIIQESLRPIVGDAVVDASIAALRQKLADLQPDPATEQRKQITVLFADLSGFTAMSEKRDVEEVTETMNALWSRIDSVIIGHGGMIDKHIGDSVMALWGVEAAHEDDPERAIRAALMMQSEVADFTSVNTPASRDSNQPNSEVQQPAVALRMRIGINTGLALLGPVGSRGEFTAIGDAVNVASRLEHAAPIGSILISHDTFRHVKGVFEVQALESFKVKGRTEPVQAYVVNVAKPRAFLTGKRGVEGIETRMIGRHAELERMLDAFRATTEDQELQIMTIIGDAGLGKSRLLFEFNKAVELMPERIHYFNGRANEAMRGVPYALLRNVFSFRFEIQDSDPALVARRKLEQGLLAFSHDDADTIMRSHFIGHLIGLDFSSSQHLKGILDDAKQIRDRTFHYVTQFFAAVARDAPLVVYLDDLQWADDGSLDLIDYIARTCKSAPILILCLARPTLMERRPSWGEGQMEHIHISLQPLSKRESRQLTQEILRQVETIPPTLRELVVGGAEGNPFYVEELIKMLIDQKAILTGSEKWEVDITRLAEVQIPSTLTGVLQSRLDGLPSWQKTVLQRASIVGRVFWDSAVESLGDESEPTHDAQALNRTSEALEALRQKELNYRREASAFAGANEYIFKHALLRDVTYESVLKRERRKYHAQAASWLIERSGERVHEYAVIIAEHFERADAMVQATEWYGRAGHQAREAYAPETAVDYYRKALEFLPAPVAGAEQQAEHHLERVEWYAGLGEALWMQARFIESMAAYEAMRLEAEASEDAVAQARAWNGLAYVQETRGFTHAAVESAQRAMSLVLGDISEFDDFLVLDEGDQQSELLAKAAKLPEPVKLELARALLRQGWASYRLAYVMDVISLARNALALSADLGKVARRERADSLKLLGVANWMLGHSEQAFSYIEQALSLFRELGDRRNVGQILNDLGGTDRSCGNYVSAIARFQEALTIAREVRDRTAQITCLNNLGGARVGVGNFEEAETDLRQVISMAESIGGYWALSECYAFLTEACLGQNKVSEALDVAQSALHEGQQTGNQQFIAAAWRALGLVATRLPDPLELNNETRDPESCFSESLRMFTEMGAETERARTLREWARYEETRGNQAKAQDMISEAHEIFKRLGMALEAQNGRVQ